VRNMKYLTQLNAFDAENGPSGPFLDASVDDRTRRRARYECTAAKTRAKGASACPVAGRDASDDFRLENLVD